MEQTKWVQEGDKIVNLHQVASIEVDRLGETQEHIGNIKFVYEGGSANLSFGTMDDPDNKKRLNDMVAKIENIIATGELGNWVEHRNIYVNLDAVGSIIVKRNGVGANNIAQIQFQYIVKRTKFSFDDVKKPENRKVFEEKLNEIKSKIDIL